MRRVMVIDTRRCVGCEACVVACKTENSVPAGAYRDWVVQRTSGELPHLSLLIQSQRCNHCDDAPCVSNCPTGASFHREDGTVQIDRDRCTGCRACMTACPFEARYVHPEGYADKCTLCVHRLDAGQPTACEEVCPTRAILTGDLDDPASPVVERVGRARVSVLEPERGTEPNVYYLQ